MDMENSYVVVSETESQNNNDEELNLAKQSIKEKDQEIEKLKNEIEKLMQTNETQKQSLLEKDNEIQDLKKKITELESKTKPIEQKPVLTQRFGVPTSSVSSSVSSSSPQEPKVISFKKPIVVPKPTTASTVENNQAESETPSTGTLSMKDRLKMFSAPQKEESPPPVAEKPKKRPVSMFVSNAAANMPIILPGMPPGMPPKVVPKPMSTPPPAENQEEEKVEKVEKDEKENSESSPVLVSLTKDRPKPSSNRRSVYGSMTMKGQESILFWCQERLQSYSNVTIIDLFHSFQDGLALCALVNSINPELLSMDGLTREDKRNNFQLAFEGIQKLGVDPAITVDEVIANDEIPKSTILNIVTLLKQSLQ